MTQKGILKGYGTVWYYPDGIARILYLYNVHKNIGSPMTVLMESGLQK